MNLTGVRIESDQAALFTRQGYSISIMSSELIGGPALENNGGNVMVFGSRLIGFDQNYDVAVKSSGDTVVVGSQLSPSTPSGESSGVAVDGIATCAGVYDENLTLFATSCPKTVSGAGLSPGEHMKSPDGEYTMSITDDGILISGPGGTFSLDSNSIDMESDRDFTLVAGRDISMDAIDDVIFGVEDDVLITSADRARLTAGGDLEMSATGDATLEAIGDATLDGTGSAAVTGTSVNIAGLVTTEIGGPFVKIEGVGGTEIKGATISLNGVCRGASGFGNQVIVSPVSGVGSVLVGSPTVFIC